MTLLSPSSHTRLNEAVGFLFFLLGLAISLSLISYSATDPSWNTATALAHTHNLLGLFGARWADLLFQIFGVSVFLLPVHIWLLGWKWVRSSPIESPWFRVLGASALWFCVSTACGLIPRPWLIAGVVRPSGIVGMVMADFLLARFDLAGAAIITVAAGIIALYFASTFEVSTLMRWLRRPIAKVRAIRASWRNSRELRRQRVIEKAKAKAAERAARRNAGRTAPDNPAPEQPPFEPDSGTASEPQPQEIPIRTLEYQPAIRTQTPEEETDEMPPFEAAVSRTPIKRKRQYRLPSTELLNEVSAANGYDGLELKAIAGRIKSKLEEFNVRGSVVQINPGPVVTTFEYKPEAGIKYSRITTLNEDLCLGLQAES
ncbi:MAG: DNA translocase FtsK 4TM domain-containing protein, partial [Acidobacteriaceae bacterium]|nr:DNA translocase FtsK 4TM domain-containing protein [Acidobacteriaceae bacterium]